MKNILNIMILSAISIPLLIGCGKSKGENKIPDEPATALHDLSAPPLQDEWKTFNNPVLSEQKITPFMFFDKFNTYNFGIVENNPIKSFITPFSFYFMAKGQGKTIFPVAYFSFPSNVYVETDPSKLSQYYAPIVVKTENKRVEIGKVLIELKDVYHGATTSKAQIMSYIPSLCEDEYRTVCSLILKIKSNQSLKNLNESEFYKAYLTPVSAEVTLNFASEIGIPSILAKK